MPIPAQAIDGLAEAVARTFSLKDLERAVLTATGDGLFEAWVGPGQPLRGTAFDLLVALNQAGAEVAVLAEMVRRRQGNPGFVQQVGAVVPAALQPRDNGSVGLSLQAAGAAQPDPTGDAFAPGLQKVVRPALPFLDVEVWLTRLSQMRRRVCRIEITGRALGTGFLVGPSAVLTNWHVVETAIAEGRFDETACRFDYVRLPDGTRSDGIAEPVAGAGPVAHAPYAPAERTDTPDTPPPTDAELDFALLTLAHPLGDEVLPTGPRGWIALPEVAPALGAGAPIMILQHPGAAPLKLAIDTQAVIGAPPPAPQAGPRVRYRTNTEGGSSGSPVFTLDWQLALLHHFGDPGMPPPDYNQGIPADRIRAAILAAGQGALLGAAA